MKELSLDLKKRTTILYDFELKTPLYLFKITVLCALNNEILLALSFDLIPKPHSVGDNGQLVSSFRRQNGCWVSYEVNGQDN